MISGEDIEAFRDDQPVVPVRETEAQLIPVNGFAWTIYALWGMGFTAVADSLFQAAYPVETKRDTDAA